MFDISQILRQKRLENRYSQHAVAQVLEISQNAYHKLESGKTELRLEVAARLAILYQISIYEFINPALHEKLPHPITY
ncbi:MAG: helix-turn-helix transcriptional regulator [Microscillaceae bacterium]|jgi:transcriptional regulator with XRE-family HTH domain|nr:helix-turn-helix transcriptional regulator [Microscillaceae bacterium]